MFNNSNPLRNNVVALWSQAGLSKFTTAGVLFFASFLFVQAKRNEENAIKNAKLECFLFFWGVQ